MPNTKKQLIDAELALDEAQRILTATRVRLARMRVGVGKVPSLADATNVLLYGVAICDLYERVADAVRDVAEDHASTCPMCQVS